MRCTPTMLTLGSLASLLCAQQPPPSMAQEDAALLEALLNTPINVASSKAQGILSVPSTVTVIDRETIHRYQCATVEEALDRVAGFNVLSTPSKRRSVPTARGILQDNYASKILLLIDGVPTWHGSLGEGASCRVDIQDIDRIEVLRGPASVLYGSNAYVGTVNLVLRRAERAFSGSVRGGLGSHQGHQGGANVGFKVGDLEGTVGVNRRLVKGATFDFTDSEGVTAPYQDYDDLKNATATLRWKGHTLLLNAHKSLKGFMGPDTSFSTGAGKDETTQGEFLHYGFQMELRKGLALRTGLTHDANERNFARNAHNTVRSEVEGQRQSAFLRMDWQATPTFNLEGGVDYDIRKSPRYQNLNVQTGAILNENNMKGRSTVERSAFLQGTYAKDQWTVLVGSRYVDNERAGQNVSSRLTTVFALDDRSSLKFIAGQSFRAPTLFEQFFSRFGNPGVKPEKATSYEVAYLTAFKGLFAQALIYQAEYTDKIVRARTNPLDPADTTVKYMNSSPFKATGLEVELKYINPRWVDLFLSVDSLLRTDRGDEIKLPAPTDHYNFKYVPKTHVKAGASKAFGPFFASANLQYQSAARGSQPGAAEVAAQTTYSLQAGYSHAIGSLTFHHAVAVKNAGDRITWIANYANLDQPRLGSVPLEDLGRQVSYTLRMAF